MEAWTSHPWRAAWGILISTWLADHLEVDLGDPVTFFTADDPDLGPIGLTEGDPAPSVTVIVTGVYEPLWNVDNDPPTGY
ncbi:MAG: hypothetical protein AAGA59_12730 [Actinomycetota bacterium]